MNTAPMFPSAKVLQVVFEDEFVLAHINLDEEVAKTVPAEYLGRIHLNELGVFLDLDNHVAPTILKAFDGVAKELKGVSSTTIKRLLNKGNFSDEEKTAWPTAYAVWKFRETLNTAKFADETESFIKLDYPGYSFESKVLNSYLYKKMCNHKLKFMALPHIAKDTNFVDPTILTDFIASKMNDFLELSYQIDDKADEWIICAEAYATLRNFMSLNAKGKVSWAEAN